MSPTHLSFGQQNPSLNPFSTSSQPLCHFPFRLFPRPFPRLFLFVLLSFPGSPSSPVRIRYRPHPRSPARHFHQRRSLSSFTNTEVHLSAQSPLSVVKNVRSVQNILVRGGHLSPPMQPLRLHRIWTGSDAVRPSLPHNTPRASLLTGQRKRWCRCLFGESAFDPANPRFRALRQRKSWCSSGRFVTFSGVASLTRVSKTAETMGLLSGTIADGGRPTVPTSRFGRSIYSVTQPPGRSIYSVTSKLGNADSIASSVASSIS